MNKVSKDVGSGAVNQLLFPPLEELKPGSPSRWPCSFGRAAMLSDLVCESLCQDIGNHHGRFRTMVGEL